MKTYRIYSWCDEHGEMEEFIESREIAEEQVEVERECHGKCQGFYIELYEATEELLGKWRQ